jgi:hypothetical protein
VLFHLVLADSELPNDNPSLRDPCGVFALLASVLECPEEPAVMAEARAPEPTVVTEPHVEENADEDVIEIVDEFDPVEFEIAVPAAMPEPELADDPFATFVRTLVEVAQDAGCSRAAALLPALLDGGLVEAGAMGEPTIDCLVHAGVLARGPSGLVGGEAFRRTADAWRAILRGDSDDFGACGPRMLDEWAADLVARIVAAPARTEQLRRELRTRGVAAFGLVMAA